MTTLTALVAVAALVVVLWRLVHTIAGDGAGHRPPPPSHQHDFEVDSPRWWAAITHR